MSWRDILRPIRDGLRDNLPERRKPEDRQHAEQRQHDALKGFAYFESFEGVEAWRSEDVLPLQQANTPLLRPPASTSSTAQRGKAKLTLIHDFAGNYHDYERCQGTTVPERVYTLDYAHFVDVFVYFSHKVGL